MSHSDLDAWSAVFDEANAKHERLAHDPAVLEALEDFVVVLTLCAQELGIALKPGWKTLAVARQVAERGLPGVVGRLLKASIQPQTPAPPPPPPPRSRPGL